ncbi:hypothetical protein Dimus_037107, partial [Dionaea muscipula]
QQKATVDQSQYQITTTSTAIARSQQRQQQAVLSFSNKTKTSHNRQSLAQPTASNRHKRTQQTVEESLSLHNHDRISKTTRTLILNPIESVTAASPAACTEHPKRVVQPFAQPHSIKQTRGQQQSVGITASANPRQNIKKTHRAQPARGQVQPRFPRQTPPGIHGIHCLYKPKKTTPTSQTSQSTRSLEQQSGQGAKLASQTHNNN